MEHYFKYGDDLEDDDAFYAMKLRQKILGHEGIVSTYEVADLGATDAEIEHLEDKKHLKK